MGNINVHAAWGWCYSQRDKVVSYEFNVYAGQARLGFENWLVEKFDVYSNIWYEQSKKSCLLVYTHTVNKISTKLLQKTQQPFVHENPFNLGISVTVTMSGVRSVV